MSNDLTNSNRNARFLTLDVLIRDVVSHHINPPPKPAAFRLWLKRSRIQVIKSNPSARRGGGRAYYNVSAVEKMLRARTIGGLS